MRPLVLPSALRNIFHTDAVEPVPRRDVLVLSGGGLHGAAQAGMLEVLAGTGWQPDVIVGVSAGALNGAWLSCGFTSERAAELADVWTSLEDRGVFFSRPVSQLLKIVTKSPSVQSGVQLKSLIERCSPVTDLADTQVEMHVGATELVSGKAAWFESGGAVSRLMASAAVPGLVPPVTIDGVVYVDGAVAANVPVRRAVELGATRIVCLDVSADPATLSAPTTALGVLLKSFSATRAALAAAELELATVQTDRVWHIAPQLPDDLESSHWHRTDELRMLGIAEMNKWLASNVTELTAPHAPPPPRRAKMHVAAPIEVLDSRHTTAHPEATAVTQPAVNVLA